MAKRLSPNTQAVYTFIEAHIHKHGFAPTYRQIGKTCGITSVSVVREHVLKLVAAGKLCKTPFAARGLALPRARAKVDIWQKRGTEYVRVGTIE